MRAYVLDTDVLVAAFRSDAGASRQVLEAARARRFNLLLSVPLMVEYESILTRPEHVAACRASREEVSAALDELASVAKRVALVIRTRLGWCPTTITIVRGLSGRRARTTCSTHPGRLSQKQRLCLPRRIRRKNAVKRSE
jgi:predicted nucleic acid-binding protein